MVMAPVLSQYISIGLLMLGITPSLGMNLRIQIASIAASAAAMYSASIEDIAVVLCLELFQSIAPPFITPFEIEGAEAFQRDKDREKLIDTLQIIHIFQKLMFANYEPKPLKRRLVINSGQQRSSLQQTVTTFTQGLQLHNVKETNRKKGKLRSGFPAAAMRMDTFKTDIFAAK
ncbi:hypothetical protein Tco_1228553 [Tanacetum coccineum]